MKNLTPALNLEPTLEPALIHRQGVKNQPTWNYQELYELIAVKGINMSQAARMYNVSPQAIAEAVHRYEIPRPGALKTFKENKADILAAKQMELLYSLDGATIKRIPPYHRIVGYGVFYDKERLERNQSTDNVQINQVTIVLDKLNKAQAKLHEDLAKLEE